MNGFLQNLISYTKAAWLGFRELKNLSLSSLRKVFSLMGKTEKIVLLCLLIVAVVSLALSFRNFYYQHTVAVPAAGGKYSEGLLGQPTYLNPLLARVEPDLSLTKLIFSGLYKYDKNGQLAPDLADGMPTVSEDQKEYTINLKRDAKWHNSKTINADDVIFTISLLKDPAYKSPLRPLWQATTVTKLSDYSLKFVTKDVSGPFMDNLTLGILPKGIWSNVDSQNFLLSKNNLEAVGSGPFKISEIKKLPSGKVQQIALNTNADYYYGSPKIDEVIFKFYDGEEDLLNAFHSREILAFGFIPLGSTLYLDEQAADAQIKTIPLPQYQVAFFNLSNPVLADQNVRHALSLASAKDQIIQEVFKGNALPANSPLSFANRQNQPLLVPSNIEEAKKTLESAGWKTDPKTSIRTNKRPLEITITTNDSMVNSKAAEILAQEWRKLNIKVNLNLVPREQFVDNIIKPRAFDVLLFPQKFGADPDPFLFWHSSQVKDPGFNLTGFSDTSADKLIIDARSTTDRVLREQKYQEFNKLISAKFPVIFLNQTQYIYVLDNSLKGLNLGVLYDISQRFSNIPEWHITTRRVWK